MDELSERTKAILIVLGGVLLIALILVIIFYRSEQTLSIQSRWWEYSLSVKYDVETTSCDTDSKGRVSCTSHTHTYTRCANRTVGNDLPPIRPPLPCPMQWGDYLREGVDYYVDAKTDGGSIERQAFASELWEELSPGHSAHVKTNLFGYILSAERSK